MENGQEEFTEIGLHRRCPGGGAVLRFHSDGMQWCDGCEEQVYGASNILPRAPWSIPEQSPPSKR